MKNLLLKILVVVFVLVILLRIFRNYLPDWLKLVFYSDPRYIREAIEVACDTYKYDHRRKKK